MAKADLGTKRNCPKCSSKFYDLKKHPAHCPICGHDFDPEAPVKKRGKRKTTKVSAEDAKSQVLAASASKKRKESSDDDDIELPEFEDLGIMEDMDDLDDMEEVEGLKGKASGNSDEDEDEDLDLDDDMLDEDEEIDLDDEDFDDEDKRR